jgi:dihydrofolate reductase
MRKLTVNTFMTLDGVMQAPGGPEEDTSGGFTHGGWSVNYWDEAMGKKMEEWMGKPNEILLGRKTYDIFAAYWPHTNEPPADIMNNARKYVASRTLNKVEWQNSTLIRGDVGEEVASLKDQDGPEIQVHGSGDLIQTLLKHNLIDEFQIMLFPVLLGTGKRLFAGGTIPANLKVLDSEVASTGVVIAKYQPAGDIPYGSFAAEEPSEAELERRARVGT